MLRSNIVLLVLVVLSMGCGCAKESNGVSEIPVPEIMKMDGFTHKVEVQWNKVNNAQKYEVRYATVRDMKDATRKETTSSILEVSNLDAATAYYFSVRAYDGADWTKWSAVKEGKTANFSAVVETFNALSDSAYVRNHDSAYIKEHEIYGYDWGHRRLAFKNLILSPDNNPDILVLQEVRRRYQIADIAAMLKDGYDAHINAHEIDPRGVLWKKDKFNLVDYDDEIRGYGNLDENTDNGRYVTCVRLKEIKTGKELFVISVHPSSGATVERQQKRKAFAEHIASVAKKLSEQNNIPVLVCGDFNNYPSSYLEGVPGGPLVMKSLGFSDTYDETSNRKDAEYQTYNSIFKTEATGSPGGSKRIDYIFTYPKEGITVSDYRIVFRFQEGTTAFTKPRASDHHPVRSTLHFFY